MQESNVSKLNKNSNFDIPVQCCRSATKFDYVQYTIGLTKKLFKL